MANQHIFFQKLGKKVRQMRQQKRLSQEDMIFFGFSARHWQQIEAGRPITLITLLRICEVFEVTVSEFTRSLDDGIYYPVPEIGHFTRRSGRTKVTKIESAH